MTRHFGRYQVSATSATVVVVLVATKKEYMLPLCTSFSFCSSCVVCLFAPFVFLACNNNHPLTGAPDSDYPGASLELLRYEKIHLVGAFHDAHKNDLAIEQRYRIVESGGNCKIN